MRVGFVQRFAAKLHEWVIHCYTVFSLLCSYLGFQMLMMMHLKNITQMWKKRNQKPITNRWVSVSSDFLRSYKKIWKPLVPGGVRWSHISLFELAHHKGMSGCQDKSFTKNGLKNQNNNSNNPWWALLRSDLNFAPASVGFLWSCLGSILPLSV